MERIIAIVFVKNSPIVFTAHKRTPKRSAAGLYPVIWRKEKRAEWFLLLVASGEHDDPARAVGANGVNEETLARFLVCNDDTHFFAVQSSRRRYARGDAGFRWYLRFGSEKPCKKEYRKHDECRSDNKGISFTRHRLIIRQNPFGGVWYTGYNIP